MKLRVTQLTSEKHKASTLKETAAALKDAAAGSERLHPPAPAIQRKPPIK